MFFKKFKYIIYSFSELLLVITHPLIGILISPLPKYFGKTISKDAPTVVIVERWMNSNIFHNFWKYYLEKKDLNVYLVSLRLQKGNFDESAQELKKFIDTENLENMILVGISGGGISAYLYLQNYDGWRKVKNFISIGTPFRGSSLIFPLSLFIYSAEELLPESKLIKKIKKEKVKKTNRIICIQARFDELVSSRSGYLVGTKKKVIEVVGHNVLHMGTRKTYDEIVKYVLRMN